MKQFELELKNEKQGVYKRIMFIILFLNFIFFIYAAGISTDPTQTKWYIFAAVITFASTLFNWYRNKRVVNQQNFSGNYIALVFAWVVLKNYWLALAHLVLMILFIKADSNKMIKFMSSHIYIQGWPHKKIQWDSVSNIILKDGLLTIDLKNNRLLQANIVENWSHVQEQAFNQFCHDQINLKLFTPI